ncbi:MAG: FtsX-like permease family protein, partial [Candidatus Cloacimonetes bacterium]|nr:FtsX-like permease family protein [Candidatus Cloacimonadota bacterium]
GLSDRNLQNLFLLQSLFLCSFGIILGLGFGSLLLMLQKQFGIVKLGMGDTGAMVLPVKFMLTDYLLITLVSYTITVVSVLLPLKRIGKINAVELIRRSV